MIYYFILGGILYYFKQNLFYYSLNTINLISNFYNNLNKNKKYIEYIENNNINKLIFNNTNLIYNENQYTIINFYNNNKIKKIIYNLNLDLEPFFNYPYFNSPIISFNIKINNIDYDLTEYLNSLLHYNSNITLNNDNINKNLWINIINFNNNLNYKNENLIYNIICEDISIYNGEILNVIVQDGILNINYKID